MQNRRRKATRTTLLLLALAAAVIGATAATAGGARHARPHHPGAQPQGYAFKALNGKLRIEEADRVTFAAGGSYTNKITTIIEIKHSRLPAGIVAFRRGVQGKLHVAGTAEVHGTETLIRSDGTRDPCSGSGSKTIRSAIDIDTNPTKSAVKESWNLPTYYFGGRCGRSWGFENVVGHETDPQGLFKRMEPVVTVGGQRVLVDGPQGDAHQTVEWKGTLSLKRFAAPGT